ncbi:MAG: hypothetical protein PVG38_05670, partial [Gammaproteobacteria bacterium]
MRLLYVAAWVVILGFLVWSANLLLRIQSIGSETAELHELGLHLDSLAGAWRDLNRPGNDVLENYEVDKQRAAFGFYSHRYEAIHDHLQRRLQNDPVLRQFVVDLRPIGGTLVDFAEAIFQLAEEREGLRLAQAQAELISEKETAAATAMAR